MEVVINIRSTLCMYYVLKSEISTILIQLRLIYLFYFMLLL